MNTRQNDRLTNRVTTVHSYRVYRVAILCSFFIFFLLIIIFFIISFLFILVGHTVLDGKAGHSSRVQIIAIIPGSDSIRFVELLVEHQSLLIVHLCHWFTVFITKCEQVIIFF